MKKGSVELGVNAIVVLIIALAVLGLGIAFITNLFNDSEKNLGGIVKRDFLPIHADATNPILFDPPEVSVKANNQEKFVVSVFNGNVFADTDSVGVKISECTSAENPAFNLNAAAPEISLITVTQKIPVGTDAGYKGVIKAKAVTTDFVAGTYICKVEAYTAANSVTGQIFIKVAV